MIGGLQILRDALRELVLDKKVPRGIGFSRALGTGLLLTLMVQVGSGMLLALAYAPTPDHAHDSVQYIDSVAGGRLLRGLHHWGSSAVIVLIAAHMVRVFFTAAYKRPRQVLWTVGVGILLVVLGFGFTGYLLPWDQKGYWGTVVGLQIAETVPQVGPALADLIRGGQEVGAPTLNRMYALHVIFLPMALAVLVTVHLFLVHRQGITPPGLPVGEPEEKTEPFFPDHVFRELLVGCLALAVVAALAWWVGPPLEERANLESAYEPRPEWYFLGLFQLLKYFEGPRMPIGTVVIPGALMLGLLLLPWLDWTRSRRLGQRPLMALVGFLVLGSVGTLTVLGAMDRGHQSSSTEEDASASVTGGGSSSEAVVEEGSDPPRDPVPSSETDPKPALPAGLDVGLIEEYECTYCHSLQGEGGDLGTAEGPPLEEVARGRDSAWLDAFLLDPRSVYPDTEMPSAADLDMSEEVRQRLVQALLSLASD